MAENGVISTDERERMMRSVRLQVAKYRLTYVWLINQLEQRGLHTNKSEMAQILAGKRTGWKADNILTNSLAVLDRYSAKMKC